MTGLRRDAGAGEKLFERDKFIALRAERVDDLKCSICAGIIQIVQKNDVAGSDIFDNMVRDKLLAAHTPVHRVERPEDEGNGDGAFERLARKAPWRTDPVAAVAEHIAQGVVCFLNFTERSSIGGVKPRMSEAVVADLMPLVLHAADDRLISCDLLADEKERCMRAAFFEPVKERGGRLRRGTVVKRERDAAPRSWRGRDRNGPTILELEKAQHESGG